MMYQSERNPARLTAGNKGAFHFATNQIFKKNVLCTTMRDEVEVDVP
jgi:hypothetical protein